MQPATTTQRSDRPLGPDGYRILQALGQHRSATMAELVIHTGHSAVEIAGRMFHLKQMNFVKTQPVMNGRSGDSHTVYSLTEDGKAAVPPEYIRDLNQYTPKAETGYKHVHGIAGKIDYSKPLRGLPAILYDALTRPGMDAHEISLAANIELQPTWNGLTKLVKLGIVTYAEQPNGQGKTRRVYSRAMEMTTEKERGEKIKEPPKPVLTPSIPGDALIGAIVQKSQVPIVSNFATLNPSLEEAIDELAQRHSLPDIMLALLARLDGEWKSLTEFRDRILKHAKGTGQ